MRTFNNCLIAALALLPAAAQAEDSADSADTIVVTAARYDQKISEVGKSISVIGLPEIEQRQTLSVAELLRTLPGVTIQSNGGAGAFTSIFIRGAQSEQTVALVDGVKINDPASPGGGFNFADLLTDNLERIEVLRGPQSVLWGSRAIGGVVNIITREPTDALSFRASADYGRYDHGHVSGAVTGKAGPVGFSAGAGYLTTDGISVADSGTERDGYHLFGVNLKTVTEISDSVSIDLRGYYTKSKVDFDGFPPPTFAVLADTAEYQRQQQMVGYAGINAALFDGRLKNRIATAYTLVDKATYDPAGTPLKNFDTRGRNLRFEYQGVADLGLVQATFGAEHEQERFRIVSIYSPLSHKKANTDSVYIDLHAKPFEGLNLGAGIRYDDHSQFGHATTKSADAAYSPNGGRTTVRASYGEGFKAPTLYQLYGDFGFEHLQPERAKGWDAGISQSLIGDTLAVSATWFNRRVTSQIDFDLGTSTYANIARAHAEGVELELRIAPTTDFLVTANYSFTDARNRQRGDANFGKQLARRPRQSVNVTADYSWSFGLRTGATITHVANSFDDAANTARLGSYVLVDVRAAMPVTDAIELFARVENLFDEQYETARGYGQPGRAAYGGVRLRY
ncbi:TonB-dependent receptor plug domain-containing protein [Rhizorhabdus argentea]|uniref:TonB-dependent receptor plug domain-containing protein n=1 Tax=Rhizorhabdus argentea TaxID=1387174 RepID=UPI0030EE4EE8